MKSLGELRQEQENKISELNKKVGLFWAFSNKQFDENKTPLKEGEKYVSIGGGGYMPKGNVEEFLKGHKDIDKWYKAEVKNNKAEEKEIIYELYNHECFYTGDITTVVELFEGRYSEEKIRELYLKERKKERV